MHVDVNKCFAVTSLCLHYMYFRHKGYAFTSVCLVVCSSASVSRFTEKVMYEFVKVRDTKGLGGRNNRLDFCVTQFGIFFHEDINEY